jgi:hypothetical protein
MSLFTLIKNVAAAKYDRLTASPEYKPERTPVPLKLHQGTMVELPELDLALAQADGSILPNVALKQQITAVGRQAIFGLNVYHAYLSDGISFLRIVAKGDDVREIHLFTARDEIIPGSKEDWEFWLGRWGKDDEGNGRMEEYGLIGWPQFQVDGPPQIVYNRAWTPSDAGIEPVAYLETIVAMDGTNSWVKHEACEYVRVIGTGTNPTNESLLVSLAQCGNDASVDIFVGIPLNIKDMKILAVN